MSDNIFPVTGALLETLPHNPLPFKVEVRELTVVTS